MTEETKEVAVPQNNTGVALPAQAPKVGLEEGIDKEDLKFPRVKLMQFTSPEVQEDGSELKPGQIINSLTREECPVPFVPIFMSKDVTKWNARSAHEPNYDPAYELGKKIWQVTDPHDDRWQQGRFGADGSKPKAVMSLNFLILFEGEDVPCLISFNKTSYDAGRDLLSLVALTKERKIFSKKFKLSTKKEVNKQNEQYYVLKILPAGPSTDKEFALAEMYHRDFAHRRDEVMIEDAEVEVETITPARDTNPPAPVDVTKPGEQQDTVNWED